MQITAASSDWVTLYLATFDIQQNTAALVITGVLPIVLAIAVFLRAHHWLNTQIAKANSIALPASKAMPVTRIAVSVILLGIGIFALNGFQQNHQNITQAKTDFESGNTELVSGIVQETTEYEYETGSVLHPDMTREWRYASLLIDDQPYPIRSTQLGYRGKETPALSQGDEVRLTYANGRLVMLERRRQSIN